VTYPNGKANLTDFIWFIQNEMGVPAEALPVDPSTDPDILVAFEVALATVNPLLCTFSHIYYNLAVYNFGGDYLINWALDSNAQDDCSTYWEDLRDQWGITSFKAGVVQSTADVSTSTTLAISDVNKQLTLSDMQNLKTPYGRAYLAIAQKFGDIWGLS
jgi:hypothetical protein